LDLSDLSLLDFCPEERRWTGQAVALWVDLYGHTTLYLVSWYLVSVTRDFSHKHIHTLSASLKCHQSVNYYSGRAIHPYN